MLRDQPRPPGYWPGTPTQWREPTVDDCTWYATEFAFEAASQTHHSVHPVQGLRKYSSDTSGGTPVSVAIRDTQRLWPKHQNVTSTYGAYSPDFIERALREGATVVWGGDNEKLPPHYRRWTNNDNFNHAMASKTLNDAGRTFLYDPLGGGPQRSFYDGEWIDINALFRFNWGREAVGIVQNKGDISLESVNVTQASKQVRLRQGTQIVKHPRAINVEVVRRVFSENSWFELIGATNGNYKLVGWKLENAPTNVGYIHASAIVETRNLRSWVDVPDPDLETALEANRKLIEQLQLKDSKLEQLRQILAE